MINALFRFAQAFDRFNAWFEDRFGWFFTNGMKSRAEDPSFKA